MPCSQRQTGLVFLFAMLIVVLAAMVGQAACACVRPGHACYEDVVVSGAGISAVNGVYRVKSFTSGYPSYSKIGGKGTIRRNGTASAWEMIYEGVVYYTTRRTTSPTPPSTGWERTDDGDLPVPNVRGGESCGRSEDEQYQVVVEETGPARIFGSGGTASCYQSTAEEESSEFLTWVSEDGQMDTIYVSLSHQPTGEVHIVLSAGCFLQFASEGTHSGGGSTGWTESNASTSLIYDSSNWNVPVPVTVYVSDDNNAPGSLLNEVLDRILLTVVESTDPGYSGYERTLPVGVLDNDRVAAKAAEGMFDDVAGNATSDYRPPFTLCDQEFREFRIGELVTESCQLLDASGEHVGNAQVTVDLYLVDIGSCEFDSDRLHMRSGLAVETSNAYTYTIDTIGLRHGSFMLIFGLPNGGEERRFFVVRD